MQPSVMAKPVPFDDSLYRHVNDNLSTAVLLFDQELILRVDRSEPSKNIIRGFRAFEEMLELHPEHRGRVKFLAGQDSEPA